ncbi:putative uncharacterized protein [Akkermansia muciniphila CAG:154]|nr:putative uncharacterized protein [Akkermansia muciniphila CAG:154]
MAERASGVSAIIYSCLKSSTVFKWRSSNKSICPEPFCRTPDTGAEGFADEGCSVRGAGANKSSAGRGAFLGSGAFFPNSLACMDRNSNSWRRACSSSGLGSLLTNSGRVTVRGTFRSMVASCLERVAMSPFSSTICLRFPFSLSVLDSRFSTEPNSPISSLAVFSPTPGSPGILSELSPIRARISTTWSARSMPHCSLSFARSITSWSLPLLPGFHRKQVEEISWPRSLSWETM